MNHPMWIWSLAPVAVLALLTLTGCGQELSCGKGTVVKDGACVPDPKALSCGAGTVLNGGTCLPAPDDASGDAIEPGDTTAPSDAIDPGDSDATTPEGGSETTDDTVACVPYCVGRDCGDNGCGGSCGECKGDAAPYCDKVAGKCSAMCVPDCIGRNCGPDGCGATCGECEGETEGEAECEAFGRCVAKGWTCAPETYGAGDACHCGCGVPDPDCAKVGAIVNGCAAFETCGADGKCVSKIPTTWNCPAAKYGAADACDCGCGAPDPDCALTQLPTYGCKGAAKCDAQGNCEACAPACDGKSCGDDGCGGFCGTCKDPAKPACDEGKCVDPCSPKPLLCKVNACGDNGCGGLCGICAGNQTCQSGECVDDAPVEDPTSCKGHCSGIAPAGCSCTAKCTANGTCCKDYEALCTCTPDCEGKSCGPDGCGGTCGKCVGDKPYCGADQQCTATCTPKCGGAKCGDDGCGGTCGTCDDGFACGWNQLCVPKTWQCDPTYYGDKLGCDCGCGAADPDCAVSGTTIYGCPDGVTCGATGTCSMKTCQANADCPNQWCTGKYFQGSGKFAGTCALPLPAAKAPGVPCTFDLQCASALCVDGLCRTYCKADADCPPTQACLGLPTESDGGAQGFAGVCAYRPGSLKPCKAQADCKAAGEQCVAYNDPATLQPKYLCTALADVDYGKSCAGLACPAGHLCATLPKSFQCTLPCPGGAADCPAGWTCGTTTLHNAGTTDPADDPKVPACVPK